MAHLPGKAGTTMTATATRTTSRGNRTNATPAAAETPTKNRRVSLGTLFPTRNDMFMSGPISDADGRYANQSEMLQLLGPAPAGYAWRVKAFFKSTKAGDIADIVAELEPIQR